jgi:zinc protease
LDPVQYRLDNGLTILLLEDHTAPVVAVQVWVNVGSADERDVEAGLAHVHEHMLFKGTERRGVGEIAAAIEAAGGMINAWTSFDQTVYHVVVASRYAEEGLDVLADAVQRSTFDPEELARELEVIQEEIKRGEDIPGRVLSQNLFATAFSRHPYGRPIIGTAESVASFSRENILDFFHRWYRPDNMTVVVVGDVEPARMRAAIEARFGAADGGLGQRPARPQEPAQTSLRTSLEFRDVQESHLGVAFHVPGLSHEDVPALELLSILLGQGESSILFHELKRARRIATDIYSYLYTPREPGILVSGATFRAGENPQDPLALLEALLEQLFKLRHVTVSRTDLARARTLLESETIYERETVQGRANRLGYFHVVAGDLAFERRFLELAASVTTDDLRRVAARYLTPENLSVAFVLPESLRERATAEAIASTVRDAFARVDQLSGQVTFEVGAGGVVRHQFPNGLVLLVQEDHTVPIVSVRAIYPGGLRFEDDANNGINNFVAELLTGGTATRSAEDIARQIESMAGSIAGFSGRNSIGLQLVVLSRDFEPALELLGDCAQNSRFPPEELERVRQQILDELDAQVDDLAGSAFRQFYSTLFEGHPFQYDLLGTTASITATSGDDLRTFYETHLHPSRLTLGVVGDVSAREVIEAVERYFDVTTEAQEPAVSVPALVPRERRLVESFRDRQQAHLVLGFIGVAMDHPDRWALQVLSAVLSGQGGRLFVQLRDRQSLAYSVGAFNMVGLDAGFFATYIATSPAKVDEAVASMERELRRIQEDRITAQELERAQRYLVGERDISLQRTGNRAAYLAFDEAYGLGYDHSFSYAERILSVTPEDIQRVARQFLDLEHGVLSVVRPEGVVEPAAAHEEPATAGE